MFIANEKYKMLFVDYPLSMDQVSFTIEQYIHDNNKKNEYKGQKDILPYFCYSVDIRNKIGIKEWKKLYTFGVIRNPFDRMIDMYEFFTEGTYERLAWCRGIRESKEAIREQHRLKSRGFTKWLTDDPAYDQLHTAPFCGYRFTPQINWLSEVNDIFTFEKSSPLLNKIYKLSKTTLPSFKGVAEVKATKLKRANYYKLKPKAIEIVADSFREDIKILPKEYDLVF